MVIAPVGAMPQERHNGRLDMQRAILAIMLGSVRARVRALPLVARRVWLTGSLKGARRFGELESLSSRRDIAPTLTRVRLRPLGGHEVAVRQGTGDFYALRDTFFAKYHLPPPGIVPRTIWDLGANIGLTMAHFAALFPDSQILGVELDADNAALCRENVSPWADRCGLLVGAVWTSDGEVTYRRGRGREQGFRVVDGGGDVAARSLTLNSLVEHQQWARIDYVKMDIEGAEREVLRSEVEWAQHVGSIKVEIHEPYSVEECERDLRALGFEVLRDDRHWAAVIGVRRNNQA
jgi:FkbM family methyltransferase